MVVRRYHEWSDSTLLSISVLQAVADAAGVDPLDLAPLYQSLNPDGLDRIFCPMADGTRRCGSLSFRYADYTVTVFAGGLIEIEQRTTDSSPHTD